MSIVVQCSLWITLVCFETHRGYDLRIYIRCLDADIIFQTTDTKCSFTRATATANCIQNCHKMALCPSKLLFTQSDCELRQNVSQNGPLSCYDGLTVTVDVHTSSRGK